MTVGDASLRKRSSLEWGKLDLGWLLLITASALALRWPYWRSIPAEGDEPAQAIYALQIAHGQILPLTGNDAYAGPFFVYLLAALFRLGIGEPMLGRAIVMASSALTASATYLWARAIPERRLVALIAAGLVAVNPHMILLGHRGGATFLMPFFTTACLWLTLVAVSRDHPLWWLSAAATAGLALQASPAAVLMLTGVWIWFSVRIRGAHRLGRNWPLWPIIGGVCLILAYSPVILYNLTMPLNSLQVAGQRGYLWEGNPSLFIYFDNLRRMALQVIRQMSGVLTGYEVLADMAGVPVVYLIWVLVGLFAAPRPHRWLLATTLLPYLLVVPYLSAHYGMLEPVRFTLFMTPILALSMALAAGRAMDWAVSREGILRRSALVALAGLVITLLLGQVWSLRQYYQNARGGYADGQTLLDVSRQMVAANRGEPVYIGLSEAFMLSVSGVPYVPQVHLALASIPQEFLPADEIIGRLFDQPGPAMFLLDDDGAALVQRVAALKRLPGEANERAGQHGYGVYARDVNAPLVKPEFVLTGATARAASPQYHLRVRVGDGLELLGYDRLNLPQPGSTLELAFYWQAQRAPSPAAYMGFVHLFDGAGMTLVAQDDHRLGQVLYPVSVWQPDEIVVDHYSLAIPADALPGRYILRTGVYTWPSLERLSVPGHTDNLIELAPVEIQASAPR